MLFSTTTYMPGANCCLPQCGTSRRTKGCGIFKLPQRKDEFYQKWNEKMLQIIKKYRVEDENFKIQVKNGSVYICERHFLPEDIELTSKYT